MALNGLALGYQAEGRTQKALEDYRDTLAIQERLARQYPANVGYAVLLGGSYCNMGRRLRQNGEAKEALGWFDKAQATLEEVLRRDRRHGGANDFMLNTHLNRTQALFDLGRDAESLAEWDRALTFPASESSRTYLQLGRARPQARLGQYQEAAALAERLAAGKGVDGFNIYAAACVFSRASESAGRDAQRPEAERRQLAERYAGGAVALLRRLQSGGYFKDRATVTDMQKDKDLDPLRQRPDFQRLLSEVSKKP
jgi:tetratricopeptide (TPR) repeat protein